MSSAISRRPARGGGGGAQGDVSEEVGVAQSRPNTVVWSPMIELTVPLQEIVEEY